MGQRNNWIIAAIISATIGGILYAWQETGLLLTVFIFIVYFLGILLSLNNSSVLLKTETNIWNGAFIGLIFIISSIIPSEIISTEGSPLAVSLLIIGVSWLSLGYGTKICVNKSDDIE